MLRKIVFILFSISILNVSLTLGQDLVVKANEGLVRGLTEVTKTNHTFYSFSGVRYAQPPVGNLRFQPPVPVEPWEDTYDATYERNICYQSAGGNNHFQNEDCLFLNIYTPNVENGSLPVMVYIHGGGFVMGFSGRLGKFGPDFFMEYDVVLITLNYRLGPFGFASTNDMVIPGNVGLKDQTLALKWIQQNIKYFGGDPSKVTIFGQSAGSASVSYHLLSHKSAGLFRAAILESGSALSAWAYQRDQRDYTFRTASYMDTNFKSNSSYDLLTFLLSADAVDIRDASEVIYNEESPGNKQLQTGFYYAPVFEPEHEDAFLTKSMFETFDQGDINNVPTIIGMNAEEGISQYSTHFQDVVDAFNSDGTLLIPNNMHIDENDPNKPEVIQAIRNFYGISGDLSFKDQIAGTIRYLTDQMFARSILKQGELQSKYGDVYFYVFSYDGEMGDYAGAVAGTGNITHSEELNYLFPRQLSTGKDNTDLELFPESDVITHRRLVKLWVNFASTLNPTPESDDLFQEIIWPKVDFSDKTLEYLDINEDLSVQSNPRWEAYTFWNDLYDKYAVKPYDGY